MRTGPEQKGPHRTKRLRMFALSALALLLLIAVSGAAILNLGAFLPLRQSLAASVISDILARNVEIRGPVNPQLGTRLRVQIEDAYVERSAGEDAGSARVFDRVSFDAGYGLLLGRVGGIDNYRMSGADIVFRANRSGPRQRDVSSYARLPSQIINSPVLDNFDLSDVRISLIDEADGWHEELLIETLRSESDPRNKTSNLVLSAVFNGTPFKVSGHIPSSAITRSGYEGSFDLALTIPGLESVISGSVDTRAEIAAIEGKLTSGSASIKTLLESLGLESDLEGTSSLEAELSGPLDGLALSGLKVQFENEKQDRVTVTGSVDRSLTEPAVDLHFKTVLSPTPAANQGDFAINIETLEGNVRGPLAALTVDSVVIQTDAALLDFEEIGPISAGRVVKYDDNSVGLEDLVIRDGPLDAPYMTLTGRMSDLIAFSGLDVQGDYRFPTTLLLNRSGVETNALGVVAGHVALNDASGSFGLEELSGAIEETDLLALSFDLAIPEFRVIDALRFSTELKLPSPVGFLSAIGLSSDPLPAMGFAGAVSLSPEGAKLDGSLTSGGTRIEADIGLARQADTPDLLLSGAVSSANMDLTDVADLVDFAKHGFGPADQTLDLTDELHSALRVEIDVSVKEIVAGKKKAGNLSGRVTYAADDLKVADLRMRFLGGTVRGDFGVDLSKSPSLASAHGRMESFPLKSLMAELGLASPVSSTVYASFDVSGAATSETAFLKSLSGKLTASLWGGTLPNRTLDLAGLSVFTWLVTGNQDGTTKLVCAVLPLHFKNGSATGKSMIVETPNVQVVGGGSVNFRSGALNLAFVPRAKRKQLVEIVSPFEIRGTFGKPELTVKEAGAGRALGEIVATPLNLIGHLFTGSRAIDEDANPCRLPKNTKPK